MEAMRIAVVLNGFLLNSGFPARGCEILIGWFCCHTSNSGCLGGEDASRLSVNQSGAGWLPKSFDERVTPKTCQAERLGKKRTGRLGVQAQCEDFFAWASDDYFHRAAAVATGKVSARQLSAAAHKSLRNLLEL